MPALCNGYYRTQSGSRVRIEGESSGIYTIDFDWFEERACIEAKPVVDAINGLLTWRCACCNAGQAALVAVAVMAVSNPKTEIELRHRLAFLDAKIAAAPGWGAAVGAMDEHRREIKSALARLNPPSGGSSGRSPIVSDPGRAAALADLQRAYACLDRVYEYLVGPRPPNSAPSPPIIDGPQAQPPPPRPLPSVLFSTGVRTARKWWWWR